MSNIPNSERPTTRLRAGRPELRVVVALPEPAPLFDDVEIDVDEFASGELLPAAAH